VKQINLNEVQEYVAQNIGGFHTKRLDGLKLLKLTKILKRKNPYLFRAKNLNSAESIVNALLEAHISSNEETIFGDWLEGLAIFINEKVYGGRKSGITGVDLEFDKNGVRYLVSIKSGPNWGNSSQIKKMVGDFKTAQKVLRTSNSNLQITCVNGCCYGKDQSPDKGDYFKYCGQAFWEFISGETDLYIQIIEPLGYQAKKRNDEFVQSYELIRNRFSLEFAQAFYQADGNIDWEKIVRLNSGRDS